MPHLIDTKTGYCTTHNKYEYSVYETPGSQQNQVIPVPVQNVTPIGVPVKSTYKPNNAISPSAPVIIVNETVKPQTYNTVTPVITQVESPYIINKPSSGRKNRGYGDGECGQCCYIDRNRLATTVTCFACCEPCCQYKWRGLRCCKSFWSCPCWLWLIIFIFILLICFFLIVFALESRNIIFWV